MKKIKSMLVPLITGSVIIATSFLVTSCSSTDSLNILKNINNIKNPSNIVPVKNNLDEILDANDAVKLTILNEFFVGLNQNNIKNIIIMLNDEKNTEIGKQNKFILKSKNERLLFSNGKNSIESTLFTINGKLEVSPKVNIDNGILIGFLNDYDVKEKPVNIYMLETLKKLFNNVNNENMSHLMVKTNQVDLDDEEKIITLSTKENYIFSNNKKTLNSKPFLAKNDNFILTMKQKVSPTSLTSLQITSKIPSLNILESSFDSVDPDILNYIADYSFLPASIPNKKKIKIILKRGFVFSNGTNSLESKPFTVTTLTEVNKSTVNGYFEPGGIWENKTKFTSEDLEGVTNIGDNSFSNRNITSFDFPASITQISSGAFKNNSLTKIVIPSTIKLISNNSFSNNKLKTIVISDSTSVIGDSAFSDNKLTTLSIPNSIKKIGNNAFFNNELAFLEIPETVDSIGSSAFSYNKLSEVVIPDSIKTISDRMFANNNLLTVTLNSSLTKIGNNAFENNFLNSLIIPDSVTDISSNAFNNNKITELNLSKKLVNIGTYAFSKNELKTLKIPHSVTGIGYNAFYENPFDSYLDIEWLGGNSLAGSENWNFIFGPNIEEPIKHNLRPLLNPSLDSLEIISNSLTSSSVSIAKLFAGTIDAKLLENIEKFEIIDSASEIKISIILKIGSIFPDGLNIIYSNPIKIMDIKNLNKETVDKYFSDGGIWSGKTEFLKGDLEGVLSIDDSAFSGNKILESFDMSNSITSIGIKSFENIKTLTKVVFSDNLISIGKNAFVGCSLSSIEMPNSITEIGSEAFYNNKLTKIIFSSELTKIENGTFAYNKISEIIIPANITSIGTGAFIVNEFSSKNDITIENTILQETIDWKGVFELPLN